MKEQTSLNYLQQIEQAAAFVKQKVDEFIPDVGLILGSGLGDMAHEVQDAVHIDYTEIPHFPVSTVEGHKGRFVIGKLEGKSVIVMQGRFHYYEGYTMKQIVFPVYVMRQLGVQVMVITNAAGGMNRDFRAGDLMLISDHINWTGDNPLIGSNDVELGERFPDMSSAYNPVYRELAKDAANLIQVGDSKLKLQEGVYCGISGPSFMTPSELTMLAKLGGDAIGMSTIGEVIAARHCGLEVLGISCITDMAIGEELESLSHEQVLATANETKPKFTELVRNFVRMVDVKWEK